MATTADYLNNLVAQRNTLADNLVSKGVEATHDELFDTLVPKVLEISGGSGAQLGVYPVDPQTGLPVGDIVVPEGVKKLYETFKNNANITSVKLPDSLVEVGANTFVSCSKLVSITWGKGKNLKIIAQTAFAYNYALREAIIPDGVTDIWGYAFRNCKALTKLHIPASATNVEATAFASCAALADVTVGAGFNANLDLQQTGAVLTRDVICGIIANYADNSGKTLTLGSTNLANLTDEDKTMAAAKGLTLK